MIPHYGEVLAVLTTLSWTLCVFPFTESSRRLGPNATNHLRLLLAVLMLMVAGFFISGINVSGFFTKANADHWIWLGLSGILGLGIGDYLGFTMYSILGTRIGSVFTTLSPGAALLLGFTILGEKINLIGITGLMITVGGVIWLNLSKKDPSEALLHNYKHGSRQKGVMFGILAALCQGIGLVFAKKGLSGAVHIDPIHATWIRMFVAMAFIFLFTFLQRKSKETYKIIRTNNENGIKYVIIGTLFGPVLGVSLSLYAVSILKVSVAQTIFSLVPVFVLPFAFFFYKEKINLKSVLGVVLALAGVIILIWRDPIQALFSR